MSSTYYTIYNSTGKILQAGYSEKQLLAGLLELFSEANFIEQKSDPLKDTVDVVNKVVLPNTRIPDTVDYSEARLLTYPNINEQLDMLWHAMNNNSIPKAEPFYSIIKEVKDMYPKGTSGYNIDTPTYITPID